jgi:hypothetical protein
MLRNYFPLAIVWLFMIGCTPDNNKEKQSKPSSNTESNSESNTSERTKNSHHFKGAISNGMKGDSIFFDISDDGTKIENLTFKGYWRCSGKLEQTTVGPEGVFEINNGKVNQALAEPPNGGSTAWRFELNATIKETFANGSFRMNINNLGCDTYKLEWTAVAD